jgi:hypothetical protein
MVLQEVYMFRLSHIAAPAVLGLGLALSAVGCADRYRDVPSDAVVLREGKHELTANANHSGTVYVYDDSRHKMVYSGPVHKGDDVRIDPTGDRITINGKTVSQQELDNDHKFKIFMEENQNRDVLGTSDVSTDDGRTTVITKHGDSTTVRQPDSDTTVITKPDQTIIKNNNNDR